MAELIVEKDYMYTESGLKNVCIGDVPVLINDAGEKVYKLGNLKAIHTAIALAIATKPFRISNDEIRFIRKHLRLTQESLGELLNKSRITVSRWENGSLELEPNTETLLRLHAIEGVRASGIVDLSQYVNLTVTEISKLPAAPAEDDFLLRIKFDEQREEVIYVPSKRRA